MAADQAFGARHRFGRVIDLGALLGAKCGEAVKAAEQHVVEAAHHEVGGCGARLIAAERLAQAEGERGAGRLRDVHEAEAPCRVVTRRCRRKRRRLRTPPPGAKT